MCSLLHKRKMVFWWWVCDSNSLPGRCFSLVQWMFWTYFWTILLGGGGGGGEDVNKHTCLNIFCTYTYMCARAHTRTHTRTHTRRWTFTYIHMRTYTHTQHQMATARNFFLVQISTCSFPIHSPSFFPKFSPWLWTVLVLAKTVFRFGMWNESVTSLSSRRIDADSCVGLWSE